MRRPRHVGATVASRRCRARDRRGGRLRRRRLHPDQPDRVSAAAPRRPSRLGAGRRADGGRGRRGQAVARCDVRHHPSEGGRGRARAARRPAGRGGAAGGARAGGGQPRRSHAGGRPGRSRAAQPGRRRGGGVRPRRGRGRLPRDPGLARRRAQRSHARRPRLAVGVRAAQRQAGGRHRLGDRTAVRALAGADPPGHVQWPDRRHRGAPRSVRRARVPLDGAAPLQGGRRGLRAGAGQRAGRRGGAAGHR